MEAETLQEHRQHHQDLDLRHVLPDAEPRSPAEGKERILRSPGARIGCESIRMELLGLLPEVRMSVREIGAEEDHGIRRYPMAGDHVLRDGFAVDTPGWREEPERLLRHLVEEREGRQILESGGA